MLSRSAQGLYWMGRNLERAEHLCRLLRNQVESLVDRPVREIHFGWSRIYGSLHRSPPVGNLEPEGGEDLTLADSYTLADDLTFERSNPDSVWSCFALGRENARQMRHCISADMWTSLNGAYLRLQGQRIEDIWRTSPEDFYTQTCRDIHAFGGVAEATMYRGEGWRFIRLGRFIERAQLATSLFLAHIAAVEAQEESLDSDSTSLLQIYRAFAAYKQKYSVEIRPDRVLTLVATDPLLPSSLCGSLDAVAQELDVIGPGPGTRDSAAAQRLAGRVCALVRYEWPDVEDHQSLLRKANDYCRDLHDLITGAYMEYPIEDRLP